MNENIVRGGVLISDCIETLRATDQSVFKRFNCVQVDLTGMDRKETMAFFINMYNALVVHGTVLFGPAESTLKR